MLFLVLFVVVFLIPAQSTIGWAADFSFKEHWTVPIPPQGSPPENFTDLETSLNPEDCGSCHESQFEDWKTSLHSKSMGPGVMGQLHAPWVNDPFTCTNCHAPLAEQSPVKRLSRGHFAKNPDYLPELRPQGLVCAGCHVRKHVRYGPKPLTDKVKDPPHNSFVEVENFGDSRFCKPCHQFDPGGNRVNGKLLQNTYEEWKNSPYPEKDIHCPDCHMPKQRHLWQGIHNPEMVKKGIKIEARREEAEVSLKVINSGVGHNFPTYVTPKIVIRGSVFNKNGTEIPHSVEEKFIGWNVPVNLSKEWYDTRIPPGETFSAKFKINPSATGGKFHLVIRTFPDDFYTRFFKALLDHPPDGVDLTKIREAYSKTLKSSYVLFGKSWDL
ncbi:MAG: ammonia-forming cytochrome c nitrite reductase subunit c552 [Nitrospinota bacterium]|nr:ammonia-forming cytochrome c nitrite reductase subunit c552 [Nitrospinota bacterium]